MAVPMPLRTRELVSERMDDPALPAQDHDRALEGLARLNAVAPGASIEPGTYNWQPPSTFVDVIGEYNLRRNLSVYANLRNVTDQGATTEIYGPSTPRHARFFQTTKYGALWTFGVNWSH